MAAWNSELARRWNQATHVVNRGDEHYNCNRGPDNTDCLACGPDNCECWEKEQARRRRDCARS